MRNELWRPTGGVAALTLLALILSAPGVHAQKGWRTRMADRTTIKAAGEYKDEVTIHLESFSPVCLEPSTSASFVPRQLGNKNILVFADTRPGLVKNPTPPPFYSRAEGAISGLGWVDQRFENVKVAGEINATGGPGGKGSSSRQGLLARWDQGNNFYWFHVDFTNGTYGIMRSRFFGVMDPLLGSEGKIANFRNTDSFYLEFDLRGDTLQGAISLVAKDGSRKEVAKVGPVKDPEPHMSGVSGFLVELSLTRPFVPLEGSMANLTSEPLP